MIGFALATAAAILAIAVRAAFAPPWGWLVGNLALAWLPFALGRLAAQGPRRLAVLGIPWLLFLPNAPYLLTDLVHLHHRPTVPMWFDAALLGGCGALGLALGARSLQEVGAAVERGAGRRARIAVQLLVPLLCGYAIWLGRFERWNSWDVVTRPVDLLQAVVPTFTDPLDHGVTWAVTATFALVVFAAGAILQREQAPTS